MVAIRNVVKLLCAWQVSQKALRQNAEFLCGCDRSISCWSCDTVVATVHDRFSPVGVVHRT